MAAATAAVDATAADAATDAVPVRRGKKKLILIGAIALVLVLAIAAGGFFVMKKRAAAKAAAEAEDDGAAEVAQPVKIDPKHAPLYLPLDPFVVNLADKEADRYAQIGITFELDTGVSTDQIKAYMPAIRNAILMIISHKTSRDLLDRSGKEQLADEIVRGALKPMGIEVPMPEPVTAHGAEVAAAAKKEGKEGKAAVAAASGAAASGAASGSASGAASAVKPKRRVDVRNPIQRVHFSSFIIQ